MDDDKKGAGILTAFKSVPRDVVISLITGSICFLLGLLWTRVTSAFDPRFDIRIRLVGVAQPGELLEIHPLAINKRLSESGEAWIRDVNFADVREKVLEIRVIRGKTQEMVASHVVGSRPTIDIQREVSK